MNIGKVKIIALLTIAVLALSAPVIYAAPSNNDKGAQEGKWDKTKTVHVTSLLGMVASFFKIYLYPVPFLVVDLLN